MPNIYLLDLAEGLKAQQGRLCSLITHQDHTIITQLAFVLFYISPIRSPSVE